MIALASAALTLFHPGFLYPEMKSAPKAKKHHNESSMEQVGRIDE